MGQCCEVRTDIPERQRRVLHAVLWMNAAMFAGECAAGVLAHSTTFLADSVDMLGDATAELLIAGVFSISGVAVLRAASRDGGPAVARGMANVA